MLETPMQVPRCCGYSMTVRSETSKFIELVCGHCNDVVFIKRDDLYG